MNLNGYQNSPEPEAKEPNDYFGNPVVGTTATSPIRTPYRRPSITFMKTRSDAGLLKKPPIGHGPVPGGMPEYMTKTASELRLTRFRFNGGL